ncbi:chorismate mutase [Candidatus Latescibacterota bacterium]
MDEIADWRKRIDEIDERLAALLNERAGCAVRIGKIKRKKGMEIFNPDREKNILERIKQLNNGPLDDKAFKKLFELIIEECRNTEEKEK